MTAFSPTHYIVRLGTTSKLPGGDTRQEPRRLVPMIPVDLLPPWLEIVGVPRALQTEDAARMIAVRTDGGTDGGLLEVRLRYAAGAPAIVNDAAAVATASTADSTADDKDKDRVSKAGKYKDCKGCMDGKNNRNGKNGKTNKNDTLGADTTVVVVPNKQKPRPSAADVDASTNAHAGGPQTENGATRACMGYTAAAADEASSDTAAVNAGAFAIFCQVLNRLSHTPMRSTYLDEDAESLAVLLRSRNSGAASSTVGRSEHDFIQLEVGVEATVEAAQAAASGQTTIAAMKPTTAQPEICGQARNLRPENPRTRPVNELAGAGVRIDSATDAKEQTKQPKQKPHSPPTQRQQLSRNQAQSPSDNALGKPGGPLSYVKDGWPPQVPRKKNGPSAPVSCKFWCRTGLCDYGNRCRFAHVMLSTGNGRQAASVDQSSSWWTAPVAAAETIPLRSKSRAESDRPDNDARDRGLAAKARTPVPGSRITKPSYGPGTHGLSDPAGNGQPDKVVQKSNGSGGSGGRGGSGSRGGNGSNGGGCVGSKLDPDNIEVLWFKGSSAKDLAMTDDLVDL